MAVAAAAGKAVTRARSGGGPGFIEAVTYRWYGHVDWRDDIDVGVNRSQDDVENWKARDPIARLLAAMTAADICSTDEAQNVQSQLDAEIDADWQRALSDPYPPESALLGRVYARRDASGKD